MSTPAASSGVTRRRPHRKSRDGCAECKRRHIRCDKGRPACTNCTIAERTCVYPASAASATKPTTTTTTTGTRTTATPAATGTARETLEADSKSPGPTISPRAVPSYGNGIRVHDPVSPSTTASAAEVKTTFPRLPFHDGAFPESTTRGASSSAAATTTTIPSSAAGLPPLGSSTFTASHLVLLHHASTDMPDHMLGRGQTTYIVDIALRYAVESPYLIDQLLAFASAHLGYLQTASRGAPAAEPFRHQATELQTRALAYFTRETELLSEAIARQDATSSGASSSVSDQPTPFPPATASPGTHNGRQDTNTNGNGSNLVSNDYYESYHGAPRFLFATFLGLHVLAETLLYHTDNLPAFLLRLVECTNLLRGVRTVVKPTWDRLLQSEIGPLFFALRHANTTRLRGAECDPLIDRIKSTAGDTKLTPPPPPPGAANPPTASDENEPAHTVRDTCLEAAEHLQWAFDMQSRLADSEGPHAPSAFSVVVSGPFVDLLRRHEPLALLVLAYFGVLVHRCRAFWIFGDSGAFLVRAVAAHLGDAWGDALQWPREQLEGT